MARGCPPRTCASEALFPGRQASAIADAPVPHILLEAGGPLNDPRSFCAASGGSKGCAQAHKKLGDGAAGHCGDGNAKRVARCAVACLGVARWRLRPGPRARARGAPMQDRPLRCQHGRRWSQSARARWRCISWRSGGRLAVPGPKSDRAAPSWRGWVARKSAAHHAMVPMQLHRHRHSRDLAARIPAIYFALH